jgi:hypothetical protein
MKFRTLAASAAVLAGLAAAALAPAGASASAIPAISFKPVTAVTKVTAHPDSGSHGDNWANDNFTRTATVHLIGQTSIASCPGSGTGFCYLWNAVLSDSGSFTVVTGQESPGLSGGTLTQPLTGAFAGGSRNIEFFSSWKSAHANLVPKTVSGDVSGRKTSTNWVEQFFGPNAVFNSAANPGGPDLGNWSWSYTANFGADKSCPNVASRWVDAANNGGGSTAVDGDILSPTC